MTMKRLIRAGYFAGGLAVAFFFFWLFWLTHISVNSIGITYNSMDGQVDVLENPGFYINSPFVLIVDISTLPIRVTIPSDAKVIVTKMVRFKVEGAVDFVNLQGFGYELNRSLENIFLGYAFSGEEYSFLEIIQEAGQEKTPVRERR